jgi:hypothetical protein
MFYYPFQSEECAHALLSEESKCSLLICMFFSCSVSVGMKHCADVLEKDHDDLEEMAHDVADIILRAVNTMEEDEFEFHRHQALMTLMKIVPSISLPYASRHIHQHVFYDS